MKATSSDDIPMMVMRDRYRLGMAGSVSVPAMVPDLRHPSQLFDA